MTQQADDCRQPAPVAPLYDTPVSLSNGRAETSDAPRSKAALRITELVGEQNRQVSFRLWTLNNNSSFRDWCAILDSSEPNLTSSVRVQTLNIGWKLNVGNDATNHSATGDTPTDTSIPTLSITPAEFANKAERVNPPTYGTSP